MWQLWRRTVELIRCYPVLWLPVLWAGCLSYAWANLRLIILHDVLPVVLRQRSVFGGSVPDTSPGKVAAFFILNLTNTVVLQYADACGYVVALFMTAKMLGRLTAEDPEDASYASISIASRWSDALWVGFLAYAIAFGIGLILFPIGYLAGATHHLSLLKSPLFIALVTFVMHALLAYFLAPVVLRLLSRSEKRGIDGEDITRGRKFWLTAAGAFSVLSFIQVSTSMPFDRNLGERALIGLSSTAFISLPYAPLFIGLSLLGAGFCKESPPIAEVSDTQSQGEASLWPEQ